MFVVGYDKNIPIISVPVKTKNINKKKFIKLHNLPKNIDLVIQKNDVFIGW